MTDNINILIVINGLLVENHLHLFFQDNLEKEKYVSTFL